MSVSPTSPMHGLVRIVIASAYLWLIAAAAAQAPTTHQHRFSDAERWAQIFDDPERDAWQQPRKVIEALDLGADATIADIGAGTGYFAMRLAKQVPRGRVYAVDVEPDMVRYLAERAKREKHENVTAVEGAPNDPRLPQKVDVVLLVDTYHHIDDRVQYFQKLHGSLKPGGRLAIIDFRMDSPVGPPAAVRLAPQNVTAELERAGYKLAQEHGFLAYQYFLVFRPAP